MTETTFVENEELENEEEEYEPCDDKELEVPPIPKSDIPVEEPVKESRGRRAWNWVKRKAKKIVKNPIFVGVTSFAAGVGLTLGYEALTKKSYEDEIETEFAEPDVLPEPDSYDDDAGMVEEPTEELKTEEV